MPSTITVPTNSYNTLAETSAYLDDTIHGWEIWADADVDIQNRAILTAFKMIERQDYQGAAVGTEKWPRTGLVDEEGVAISSASVPLFVKAAQYELSFELIVNPAVQTNTDAGDNIRSLKAGSAEIVKFKPKGGSRFPTIITEYLGRYLEGGITLLLPVAGGIGTETGLFTYNLTRGY